MTATASDHRTFMACVLSVLLVQGVFRSTAAMQTTTLAMMMTEMPTEGSTAAWLDFTTTIEPAVNASVDTPEDQGIELHLYTRDHPITYLLLGNSSLDEMDFNDTKTTVVVVHGFTGSGFVPSVTLVRDAFLYSEDVQVLAVHWQKLASGPDYDAAASNTAIVAGHLAAVLDNLITEGQLMLEKLHLVGFSLGAQVVGLTGSYMAKRPPRITALDPARPSFEKRGPSARLDPSDADFVQVLHTCGGFVSFEEPLGHVDFYPNGGKSPQPHCLRETLKLVCSHLIAPVYFVESIYKPRAFPAARCESWGDFQDGRTLDDDIVFMGPDTPNSTRGKFYLRTNAEEPYGQDAVNYSPPEDGLDNNAIDNDSHRSGRQHHPGATTERPVVWQLSAVPCLRAAPVLILLMVAWHIY